MDGDPTYRLGLLQELKDKTYYNPFLKNEKKGKSQFLNFVNAMNKASTTWNILYKNQKSFN